jgi:ubiquinone/menaquinone biosynthesis C-methylase UbiE
VATRRLGLSAMPSACLQGPEGSLICILEPRAPEHGAPLARPSALAIVQDPLASDVYTHGHQESVLKSHVWRTAENSAGYLLGALLPGLDLLDVGCGPGTLTVDLGRRVPGGRVVGIDRSREVVARAAAYAASSGAEVEFATGDVYSLAFPNASFDVVHAHQVLQHLTDPVRALREMRRVLKPGGVVAVRDSDYSCFSWAPLDPRLDRWLASYRAVARHNGAEPDAGRFLKGWVRAAGFRSLTVTSSTWTFADDASSQWWGGLWAERCELSGYAEQALVYGLASKAELADSAAAFRDWAAHPDAFFTVPHGEVLARD